MSEQNFLPLMVTGSRWGRERERERERARTKTPKIYIEEWALSSINDTGKTRYPHFED
jgi:hypothetical protein